MNFSQDFLIVSLVLTAPLLIIPILLKGNGLEVFAQVDNSKPTVFVDWMQIVSIAAPASFGTAFLTAWLNHHYSMKKLKTEFNLDLKKRDTEQQTKIAEDRKDMYERINFRLERMMNNYEFKTGNEPTDKIRDTIDKIDDVLGNNSRLARDEVKKQWWSVRNSMKLLEKAYGSGSTKQEFERFRNDVTQLQTIINAELSRSIP